MNGKSKFFCDHISFDSQVIHTTALKESKLFLLTLNEMQFDNNLWYWLTDYSFFSTIACWVLYQEKFKPRKLKD